MGQRLTKVGILIGIVALPIAITVFVEQLADFNRLPALVILASPAALALGLESKRHPC